MKLVLAGKWDLYLKAFIKMEPHKKSKREAERWRLIISFPLCVQVAWKMLFDYTNDALLEQSLEIPVQHGFNLQGGGWKKYYRQWSSKGLNCGSDASAFDFHLTLKDMLSALEIRKRLLVGPRIAEWHDIAIRLYRQAFENVKVLLPDGKVVRIVVPAVQKSGSPNTISDNGIIRLKQAVKVDLMIGHPVYPLGAVVGDDELKKLRSGFSPQRVIEAYNHLGWTIKEIEPGLKFVGHEFKERGPEPLYFKKHLWHLAYVSDEILPEYLDSMLRLYTHSPHFWMWERIANAMGVVAFSQNYYKVWYDYECDDFSCPSRSLVKHLY